MPKPPSLLVVARNFHRMAGGVERMATTMMNEMTRRGWRVGLLTWDPKEAESHYPLDPGISWMTLALGDPAQLATWSTRLRRLRLLRRMARQFRPDAVVGFQSGAFIVARLALLGLGIPVIAAERNSPDQYDYVRNGRKQRTLANLALSTARCITVQLPSYREKYPSFLRSRIVDIPNPVLPVAEPPYPNETPESPRLILNLGRLSFQKNQSFLIRSFARIAKRYPNWRLACVGDGEVVDDLNELVRRLNLEDQVLFPGASKDVSSWFARSAFLAFPSLWEGFPNALVEAFAHGVPAVGLRTTAGVNELVVDELTGLLSDPTEEAFAEAMTSMIEDLDLRKAMGRAASRSIEPYQPNTIFNRWEALFLQLIQRQSFSTDSLGTGSDRDRRPRAS